MTPFVKLVNDSVNALINGETVSINLNDSQLRKAIKKRLKFIKVNATETLKESSF